MKGLFLSLYVEIYRAQSSNHLHKKPTNDGKNIITISKSLEHIQKNYMHQITVNDLADLSHMSTSHFRRIFHQIMGATPLDYLNSTRIDKACRLMLSTDESILTISDLVGFNSISTFKRCFHKLLNTSPSIWRKKALQLDTSSPIDSILEFSGWIR